MKLHWWFCKRSSGLQYLFLRKASTTSTSSSGNTYFITTPIFYVNASPHIGHLHSAVLADALHRTYVLLGKEKNIFSTGTDEHGLKDVFKMAGVSYTDFIRTTEERHVKVVQHFWQHLDNQGFIYKDKYQGWYCSSEESFLTPSQVKEDSGKMVSTESGQPVEWTQEENYMFRLSQLEQDILHWLNSGDKVLYPSNFCQLVKHWISEGLPDLSISRDRFRLKWGIPVPNDNTQTIYVWLDALLNYLTVAGYPIAGYHWPPDCHVIGKDILRFHAIYWPAFLIAAGLEPPCHIFCHSHWTVENKKMSKSKGNVVSPIDSMKHYTSDGLRYFLLREAVPYNDANYNEDKLKRILNSELADTLGNLLSRCSATSVNKEQVFPVFDYQAWDQCVATEGKEIVDSVCRLPETVKDHFLEGNFHHGVDVIMNCARQANLFIQNQKPWELTKSDADKSRLNTVLYVAMETLRVCGILLQPVVPYLADKILKKLEVNIQERNWHDLACFSSITGTKSNFEGRPLQKEKMILFTRIK
ncbi:methionyl-tRNA synthetase, mitochondrial isoform X2 [Tachypleus tridentatus]|uniref:methionyl-tRNA synthetase, mitochondrial isoform X2 n=1 Tax=Tachypleus tridentatus TaxID=6853 RepID=UPI003FD2A28F